MHQKPLIGLNADFRAATNDRPAFSVLCAGYYDSILAAGGIPIIVPPLEDAEDMHQVLDRVDGFLMVGGADLDSHRDGFVRHTSTRLMDSRRESFDRMLIDAIGERRIPLLGVGVGMQLLNVSQGGNLFYHIPEMVPGALPHKDTQDPSHRHSLEVVPDSLMGQIYGEAEIRVNSMHHMAVDQVAAGFRVTATCPDGVVEAIESLRDDWFAIGTQFHPEAPSASAVDIRIFEEFIAGITGLVPAVKMAA